MKFIKKHASLIVAILIVVLLIAGLFVLKAFFSPTENKAIYGSRLDGRKNVPISKDTIGSVKSSLGDSVSSCDIRIAGRIIEVNMKVNESVSLDDAKGLGNKAVEGFSDKEREYYDIQIFISKDTESNQFPIIGYKHHTKGAISWTKDRAES